jgi:hypothetical protein
MDRTKIQIRLNCALLEHSKREAADRHETLTTLIEEGLRLILAQSRSPKSRRKRIVLPTCQAGGGILPGVDLDNNSALLDLMEQRR